MVSEFDTADFQPPSVEFNGGCTACSKLCSNSEHVCMQGDGPGNAAMMIIGEAPGATEDELNLPFVGQSGSFLRDEILVQAQIPESKIRFTNAVRCHPPKNRNPTALEIRKCRDYLRAEIYRIKPKVVVGMGNVPLATLLQRFYKGSNEAGAARKSEKVVGGITQWRGRMVWLREFNCWFMPTFHPSYCLRNERDRSTYSTRQVVGDLKRAWKFTEKPRYTPSNVTATVIETADEIKRVVQEMREAGTFAFDIETSDDIEGRRYPRVIGASFACSSTRGYYLPWEMVESHKGVHWAVSALLLDRRLTKIMHNGAYEVRVLRFNGMRIYDRYVDTMAEAHLVDENFSKRLKDLAWLYTDFGGYDTPLEKYKYEHRIKSDYGKIPYSMLSVYGALDSVATYAIHEKLKKPMRDQALNPLFQKIVMPVRRVMSDAEYAGIYVDLDHAHAVRSACDTAMTKLEEAIYAEAGGEFNIGSNQQLANVLFKKMGFTPLKRTKTGYSVDKESIEYVATQDNSEIAKYLSDRAYVKTMNGTHITQALEFTWEEDNRVHAFYNLTGAATGRASCSSPSLQNVPADALVRAIYTATPGNYLVEGDLKSAELATIAALSGEEVFIDAFNNGLDPHSQTFRRLYDLPGDYEPTNLERRKAKTINFGLVYGISAIGLARRLAISVEEAQEFMNLYFSRLPHIHKWMENQKAIVRKRGYVESVFHRRRRLPLGMSDSWSDRGRAERQAMNAPVQSGAADYTYIGLVRLARILKRSKSKSKIVHTVHDCGLADTVVPEKNFVVDAFHEAFETPVKAIPVRMKVDIEVGHRWGENNESRLEEIFQRVGIPKIAA